jgi:hypothetical protein
MNFRNLRLLLVALAAMSISISLVDGAAAQSESTISFEDSAVESDYPNSLIFTITAQSTQGEIISARLHYSVGIDTSVTLQDVEVDPAERVVLSYTRDTSNLTNPPSTPIVFHWEVMDSVGNRAASPEEIFYFDDTRFDWQILENENIAVWWHDRAESFGARVFEIAQKAIQRQRGMFGVDPEQQIKVIIYNDFDEFEEWHSFIGEWVGGQAFPSIGVTTQIVSAYSSIERWLNDVIPHEISHLYFFQATDHAYVVPPAWLNEGIAQLNEIPPNSLAVEFAEDEIREGNLLPLWSLTGSFGNDDDQVALAYAESLSVAMFIEERYGNELISQLLAAYKEGVAGDEALKQGLGVTLIELHREWLEWMGVDPAMYPAPTAEPTLAWPTAPTYPTPTPKATETSTPEPEPSPIQTASPSASPVQTEEQQIAGAVPAVPLVNKTPTVQSSENESGQNADEAAGGFSLCGAGAFPLAGLLLFYGASRRSRRVRPYSSRS